MKLRIRRHRKWVLFPALVATAVGAGLYLAGPAVLSSRLKRLLSPPASGLSVYWESLEILPLSRGIRLHNLKISRSGDKGRPLVSGTAAVAEFRGLHLAALLLHGNFRVDRLKISHWSFRLEGPLPGDLFAATAKKPAAFLIRRLQLGTGRMEWLPRPGAIEPAVVLHVIEVDWSAPQHREMHGHAVAGPLRIRLSRMASILTVRSIQVDRQQRRMEISGLHLAPLWPESEFSRRRGYQTDRIELRVPRLQLQWPSRQGQSPPALDAAAPASLLMESPELDVFRDRRLPRRKGIHQRKLLPYQALRRLGFSFQAEEVIIHKGRLVYGEHQPESPVPGRLIFEDINARVMNFHMGPVTAKDLHPIRLKLDCRLQGHVPLAMTFVMDPGTPRFQLEARLGEVNMTSLNALTVPLAFLRFDRGTLRGLNFIFHGDHRRMEGNLRARYRNLKVSLLKRRHPPSRRSLASLVINSLLLRSNPQGSEPLRVAHVRIPRDPGRSFINWLWRGVLDGLKRSAGI